MVIAMQGVVGVKSDLGKTDKPGPIRLDRVLAAVRGVMACGFVASTDPRCGGGRPHAPSDASVAPTSSPSHRRRAGARCGDSHAGPIARSREKVSSALQLSFATQAWAKKRNHSPKQEITASIASNKNISKNLKI
ncbi:hypothetical protein PP715_23530 [Ralstonia solanacearum]|nr:hypothetical protein [Ralstonia solanacearum]MCG3577491.1 hypothetical protein [Ralstonia solanacearum]MCL9826463.1 hypothetical protein [Ralstonia solanacearum]MCL9831293.1 hypothetical protein [Ralstonia solanacearum]MCL9836074.1 hypothetical protein [Ralstonia solanacearum]MCL9842573.1 hypothetical protein [Ralstonia solanacearum]